MPISRIKTDGIQDDAITSAKIGVDVIVADDLAANSVTVSELTDGAVTSAKLDTNIAVTGTLSSGSSMTATGEFKANGGAVFNEDSTGVDFRVESLNDANMFFVDGGNDRVGIGTSSPLDLVHILEANGTNTSTQLMLQNNNLASGTAGIAFNVTATGETTSYAPKGAILFQRTATNGRGAFKFIVDNVDDTNPFSASDEVMRISAEGNVGIGEASPTSQLSFGANIGRDFAVFENAGGANKYGIGMSGDGSGGNPFRTKIYANGVESVSITASGNVGIGTSGPQTALHLYGGDNATSLLTLDDTGTGGGRKWSFRPGDPVTPSNGYFSFRDETAGQNRIVITDGGEVRIGQGLATSQIRIQSGGSVCRTYGSTSGSGFHFTSNAIYPTNFAGSLYDANISLGAGSYRYSTIFATNGTINTSDLNEKQDIENLSDAERTVANAIKGLIKKFRFIDAVEKKGDDARIHVGVIAQDVEQVFVDAGLNPRRYGMFCEDIWYEVDGEINPDEPYTSDTPNAVRKVRLGIRYDELLAFVISAL